MALKRYTVFLSLMVCAFVAEAQTLDIKGIVLDTEGGVS